MWTLQNSTVDATNNKLTLTGITTFSDWTGSDAVNNSLPISLKSFDVTRVNDFAEIRWITSSETNNALFSVERSQDGEQWTSIYTCEGAGTTTKEHRYIFTDSNPTSGVNYYRLKQTDVDGKFTFSKIENIKIASFQTVSMQIFPMPADADDINISISSIHSGSAIVIICDSYGKEICIGEIEVSTVPIQIKLTDICAIVPGIYIVTLKCDNAIERKRIVVK